MATLMDAHTGEPIGDATAAQIEASDGAGDTGIILVDAEGYVVAPQEENQPWIVQPVRHAYVEA